MKIFSRFEYARDGFITEFAKKYLVGKKILEIGCGEGDRTKLFYTVANQVIGVDIVNKVKKEHKNHFSFLLADGKKLPFQNEYFDAIVSFDVIEHIEDDKAVANEMFRVCKRGGFLLLGTPNRLRLSNRLYVLIGKRILYPYYLGPETIHIREYTMQSLTFLIEKGGFKVCTKSYIWLGLVGRIDLGLCMFPKIFNECAQYLLIVAKK